MPPLKDIEREAERARSAKPSARVTGYERDRYVDEKHIDVTTTIGDLAGSHGAAYRALKEAGIPPAHASAGSLRLTVDEDLPLSQAKALVVAALKAAGIKVYEELPPMPTRRSHSTKRQPQPSAHARPLAARGLTSYRLRGPYGYIMIGARDPEGAMREAARSTRNPDREALEVWRGGRYIKAFGGAHATKKKSPAQLERKIAEDLASRQVPHDASFGAIRRLAVQENLHRELAEQLEQIERATHIAERPEWDRREDRKPRYVAKKGDYVAYGTRAEVEEIVGPEQRYGIIRPITSKDRQKLIADRRKAFASRF